MSNLYVHLLPTTLSNDKSKKLILMFLKVLVIQLAKQYSNEYKTNLELEVLFLFRPVAMLESKDERHC